MSANPFSLPCPLSLLWFSISVSLFLFASVLNRRQFWLALHPLPVSRPWGRAACLLPRRQCESSWGSISPFSPNHPCNTSCKYRLFHSKFVRPVCWEFHWSFSFFRFTWSLFWKLIHWLSSTFKKYRDVYSSIHFPTVIPQIPSSPPWRQLILLSCAYWTYFIHKQAEK